MEVARSEWNGSARKYHVVINCEHKEGGIWFADVTDYSLSRTTAIDLECRE